MSTATADIHVEVLTVYRGSDGERTKALYARLAAVGPLGLMCVNLLRAQKNSERAKVYRGGDHRSSYKDMAYERKQWAMDQLAKGLVDYPDAPPWGWGRDPKQAYHCWVLYVDLPTGQVSFHTERRGTGPDYPKAWDGVAAASPGRICRYAATVLAESVMGEL